MLAYQVPWIKSVAFPINGTAEVPTRLRLPTTVNQKEKDESAAACRPLPARSLPHRILENTKHPRFHRPMTRLLLQPGSFSRHHGVFSDLSPTGPDPDLRNRMNVCIR